MASDITVTACPVCGCADGAPAFTATDRNRRVSASEFSYRRCAKCATLYLENVPGDLGRYYPDDYFLAPTAEQMEAQAHAEQPKLDLVAPYAPRSSRLVEIGPGDGVFALLASRAGFAVTAVERSPQASEHLRETAGVDAVTTDHPERALADLEPAGAIVLWQVIEHVPEPGALIDAAAALLQPGGVLVIACPNPQSAGFRHQGARWAHVDAPRHLTLIPADAIADRAARGGLVRRALVFDDPSGRHWNRFAWESALRRDPAAGPAGPILSTVAAVIAKLVSPWEVRGRRGASYTQILEKPA